MWTVKSRTRSFERILPTMEHIGGNLANIERNMRINSTDPVSRFGFTQVPNFILRQRGLSANAKTCYALLLSYAWHNDCCFPGQDRLAEDMGLSRPSVTAFIKELEACGLLEIERRGLGKTNIYAINFTIKKKPGSVRTSGTTNRLKSAG